MEFMWLILWVSFCWLLLLWIFCPTTTCPSCMCVWTLNARLLQKYHRSNKEISSHMVRNFSLFKCCENICKLKSVIKIHVLVLKYWKLLFKHGYQTPLLLYSFTDDSHLKFTAQLASWWCEGDFDTDLYLVSIHEQWKVNRTFTFECMVAKDWTMMGFETKNVFHFKLQINYLLFYVLNSFKFYKFFQNASCICFKKPKFVPNPSVYLFISLVKIKSSQVNLKLNT